MPATPTQPPMRTRHIFITGLIVPTLIGIHAHEQAGPQRLRIDAELLIARDGDCQAHRDDRSGEALAATVDYAAVVDLIETVCRNNRAQLLETLSEHLLDRLFERFPLLGADLKLGKPDIFSQVENIGIRSRRGQVW